MAVLHAGNADRGFRNPRPLRDALGCERGIHAAFLDGQQQVFTHAAGLERRNLLHSKIVCRRAD
jgi:hypothetical protein